MGHLVHCCSIVVDRLPDLAVPEIKVHVDKHARTQTFCSRRCQDVPKGAIEREKGSFRWKGTSQRVFFYVKQQTRETGNWAYHCLGRLCQMQSFSDRHSRPPSLAG
jgi:hypothetical protein